MTCWRLKIKIRCQSGLPIPPFAKKAKDQGSGWVGLQTVKKLQIPRLRSDDKGRAMIPWRAVAEQKSFSSPWVGRRPPPERSVVGPGPGCPRFGPGVPISSFFRFLFSKVASNSLRAPSLSPVNPYRGKHRKVPNLSQIPGFPVEVGGVVELHAAFLKVVHRRCRPADMNGAFLVLGRNAQISGCFCRANTNRGLIENLFLLSHPPALPTHGGMKRVFLLKR